MAAPKYKSSDLKKLYPEGKSDPTLHDKQIIEALKKRLNDRLSSDESLCKKAALILENWIKQKPKK
jgi:hypothetical protein